MKTKLLFVTLVLLALGGSLSAQVGQQGIASNPLGGDLTATSASCATVQSCVWMRLPNNGSTATVTLAGTFVQTDLIELSGDGGNTWITNATLSAVGITSVSVSGFSDIRVRCSAFTSGRASVTINVGILQVQSVVSSSSSSSPSSPAPPMGYYLSNAGRDLGITNPFVFGTPANTQRANLCNYTLASTTVTCQTAMRGATASVLNNVATYSFPANVVASWAVGNSITVTAFIGGDTFFNQTCTLTVVVSVPGATSISCPLVHANASSVVSNPGIVTNTSAGPFTAFDAGTGNPNGTKRIDGYGNCTADNGISVASNNFPLVTTPTTISGFVSSLQVTISQTALFSAPTPNAACVTWGNPDDTAAAAMDLAAMSAPQCPREHLAAGYYWYNVPHHYGQPDSCTREPGQVTTTAGGNLTYAAGFEWDGRGNGTTIIHIPAAFPESGPGCINGLSKRGCFVVTLEGKVSNVMIEGGGNYAAANFPSGTNFMEMDGPATLEYFTAVNFGAGSGTSVCLAAYVWAQTNFVNISGCADYGVATSVTTSSVTMIRTVVENPRTRAFELGVLTDYASFNPYQHSRYNFICIDCWALNQNLSGGSMALMRISSAQRVKLISYRASKYIGALGVNGTVGIQMLGASGGILDIQDSFLDMTSAGTSTSTGDIGINDQAGYVVHAENNIIKGTSGGNAYTGVAASKFNSAGGNILGAMSVNAAGLLSLSPTDDLSAATGVTPTCPTVTGATATCAAVAGSTNEKGTLRMTVSAAGTAAGTVTMNFVGAFSQSNTPSCNFNWANTGTGAWNARASTWLSTRSSTAPVISWDNNAVALGNLTWDIDYSCKVQ